MKSRLPRKVKKKLSEGARAGRMWRFSILSATRSFKKLGDLLRQLDSNRQVV